MKPTLFVLAAVMLAAPAAAQTRAETARGLHARYPLIDGHNDYPWRVREEFGGDLAKADISKPLPRIHTDIARLRQGGVGGQFWSVYVPVELTGAQAVRATLEQIDLVHGMARRYPDAFELARTADDVERIFKAGRIASLIGVEGGHSIDSSLPMLRMLHALGAGYMTLTHTSNTPWADSATDEPASGGLSAFGEQVVAEMNRLGMLVDLSHVSPDTMKDALRVSRAPVIFSHSSARALCDSPRNVPDDVLALLKANGGIVMVSFVPSFVAPEGGPAVTLALAERKRLRELHAGDVKKVEAGMEAYRKLHPDPKASLSQVADHIDHIRKQAGIDQIGIGSDFDGISSTPAGLEDVSKYPALTEELLRRGYGDAEIGKILGGNLLRVMRAAEAEAARR